MSRHRPCTSGHVRPAPKVWSGAGGRVIPPRLQREVCSPVLGFRPYPGTCGRDCPSKPPRLPGPLYASACRPIPGPHHALGKPPGQGLGRLCGSLLCGHLRIRRARPTIAVPPAPSAFGLGGRGLPPTHRGRRTGVPGALFAHDEFRECPDYLKQPDLANS